jgi:hypothetical protein
MRSAAGIRAGLGRIVGRIVGNEGAVAHRSGWTKPTRQPPADARPPGLPTQSAEMTSGTPRRKGGTDA